jgi:tetratricopeptide (TPR) repeat protein
LDFEIGWATTTPGGAFQGNEIRWHFDDFEPGLEQNMEFALVAPAAWQGVLAARESTRKNPNDGETWGMLGKAYKQVFFMSKAYREDAGGQEIYRLSIEAYEKCLALKPEDAQWHAGFADLLAQHSMWRFTEINANPDTYRALNEINTALELAPDDPVVREIALGIRNMFDGAITLEGDKFDIPWLTQTPTPWPTSEPPVEEPTPTLGVTPPPPTDTPPGEPTQTAAPETTSTPAPPASNPLCGSAAFLPLMVMAWFVWKRR